MCIHGARSCIHLMLEIDFSVVLKIENLIYKIFLHKFITY